VAVSSIPAAWLGSIPGKVVRATQIALLSKTMPEPVPAELSCLFSIPDLVACDVHEHAARIWSDFRLHADGFGRLLIHDRSLSGSDTVRLVQQLQELGNYRNMALLGLPVAQSLASELSVLEGKLAGLAQDVARGDNDEKTLHALAELSAQIAAMMSTTRYRMSATKAYSELSVDRLRALNVNRIPGHETLIDFTERRLVPAARTCESFTRRLEDVAQRAAWIASMLRTRIDTAMERQSHDLLASMNRRTDLQLRLQQTVEGLSVVAITYYALGLIDHMASPLARFWWGGYVAIALSFATPVILGLTWVAVRRIRRRVVKG
jgi:uncharacterized membrane-anchored protein